MRAKQNGGLLLREKQARQLSTCLSKPLTAQRCSHRLIEHRTMEPLNEKSQIAQEYGLLPADARSNDCEILLVSTTRQNRHCSVACEFEGSCGWQFKLHGSFVHVYFLLFIVLFAKNCTNQIKFDYLNSHGEEAQEKPPGL